MILNTILEAIGNTPIVRLNKLPSDIRANVFAKLEFTNPGGSLKDRIGWWLIEDAERRGVLKPGGCIIEGTGGNTGIGLAIAAAVKRYQCIFTLPDKMAEVKIKTLRAFGARVVVTPTAVAPEDPRSYYSVARRLADETPNSLYIDQYNNLANREHHYLRTGPEILRQMPSIDALVAGIGTGGTVCGAGKYLKENKPAVKVIAVDPVGSIVYETFKHGRSSSPHPYLIEGIGKDFMPRNIDFDVLDDVVQVGDREAFLMTRKLLVEEGIYAGVSSGAALVGALRWIRSSRESLDGCNVLIIFADSGSRYIAKVYDDDWMHAHGFLEADCGSRTLVPEVRSPAESLPQSEAVATEFTKYHLTESARVRTRVPGPRSIALLDKQKALEGSIVSYPRNMPIAIKCAKGAIIEDVDGNCFLDFFAGAGVVNLGHCNEEVLDHVSAQSRRLVHALDFPTEVKLDAIERILANLPGQVRDQFKVAFVGPTGADAIEAAIKLAKMKTGRDAIVVFTGGYHGVSTGTVALTSNVRFRMTPSAVPNVHFAPFPYCYRCPVGREPETCATECFAYLRNMITNSHSGVPLPAAILIEPIQGEGGSIPAATHYLEALVDLARSHGIIVIFDEIQAGFFRSGPFLSFMHSSAIPDIITVSKAIGGVGIPLAGLIYRRSIEAWREGDHVGTFRGNQLALSACKAALDFVVEHQIQAHGERMGQYLLKELNRLVGGARHVGDIRGKGLMIGIEFVRDKQSKTPYPELVKEIRRECLQDGLLFEVGGHHGNVIRLMPPLVVTPAIIDNALRILVGVLQRLDSRKETEPATQRDA